MEHVNYLFDHRTDSIEELLQKKPRWIILHGNSICSTIVLVILAILYTINYPMEVKQPLVIDRVTEKGPAGCYFATMRISQSQLPDVHPGQPVKISLLAYPSGRYGWIKGTVSSVDDSVAADRSVHVRIVLGDDPGKALPLKRGLEGEAVISTQQKRLLSLLYGGR